MPCPYYPHKMLKNHILFIANLSNQFHILLAEYIDERLYASCVQRDIDREGLVIRCVVRLPILYAEDDFRPSIHVVGAGGHFLDVFASYLL